MADNVWILGINMTKFGKHPDLDAVDLAADAVIAALADGGVTMADMGVVAAGNLMGGGAASGQNIQKQVGQTGVADLQRVERVRYWCHRDSHCGHGDSAGEADMGLAVGVEKLSGVGLLGPGGSGNKDGRRGNQRVATARSVVSTAASAPTAMPGVFAQVGMEYLHTYGRTDVSVFAKISQKNHQHSTLNPLAAYNKR